MAENLAWVATIVGTLASIISLALAGVQTLRIRELRRHTETDSWEAVRMARSVHTVLEESAALKGGDPRVAEARGKIVELIRHLLKQAALADKNFSEATVVRWEELGRIRGDWQKAAARMHLPHK